MWIFLCFVISGTDDSSDSDADVTMCPLPSQSVHTEKKLPAQKSKYFFCYKFYIISVLWYVISQYINH